MSDPYSKALKDHLEEFFKTNTGSVSDPTTLWLAHKAFMCGIFIKLGSRARRERMQHIKALTKEIYKIKTLNK